MRNSMYKAELVGAACKGRKAWGPLCEGWRRSQIALPAQPSVLVPISDSHYYSNRADFHFTFRGQKTVGDNIVSIIFCLDFGEH